MVAADIARAIASDDWHAADAYGLTVGNPTIEDLHRFARWYIAGAGCPSAVLAVYGSQVTGRSIASSDVDAVFHDMPRSLAEQVLGWFYGPSAKLDLVESLTVWVPAHAPYQPVNLGPVPARVRGLPLTCASTLIRAIVDGDVRVPAVGGLVLDVSGLPRGSTEEPGLIHVERAIRYARSRGWRVDSAPYSVASCPVSSVWAQDGALIVERHDFAAERERVEALRERDARWAADPGLYMSRGCGETTRG